VRIAQLTGSRRALEEALTQVDLPTVAQVLGPLPFSPGSGGAWSGGGERAPGMPVGPKTSAAGEAPGAAGERSAADHQVLVRVPVEGTAALTHALVALKAFRSARKASELVSVRVDPLDMG
jgi:primosomal protein N' (replication factor Y)